MTNQKGETMSQDILEIARGMNWKDIEMQIVMQCAPLIARLKLSNLLMAQNEDLSRIRQILRRTGISYYVLAVTQKKTAMLLYNRRQLEDYLARENVHQILEDMGYTNMHLGEILFHFSKRYHNFVEGKQEFPHEMGLFLGYPVEDVIGFIENDGENCLYTGYWKVYANLSEKKALFQKFETAREHLIQLLSDGLGLVEIVQSYSLLPTT